MPTLAVSYCHPLFTDVLIAPTEGNETFEESGIFEGGIYGRFQRGEVKRSTLPTKASVFEQIADGTFSEIFKSLGEIRIRWQEGQVINFCRYHRNKLRPEGFGTLFELVDGLFIAHVRIDTKEKLRLLLLPTSLGHIFEAKNRSRIAMLQVPSTV